jgi:hypothetical protein
MSWNLRTWARLIKRDVHALYLASRDPRVPWYAKALAVVVAGYAISPIDLVPAQITAECHEHADAAGERPISRAAAALIVLLWIIVLALTSWIAFNHVRGWQ